MDYKDFVDFRRGILVFSLSIFIFINLACADGNSKSKGTGEWETVVREHLDTTVQVYGHYAAVKLPIKEGVRLWNPTAITKGPEGIMYVANYTGEIFSLHDSDGDGLEDYAKLYCNVTNDGLRYPTSIVFRGNELFVGTTQEIRVYEDVDSDQLADKSYTFFNDFPYTMHYFDWTFGLEFGPDGSLFAILCTDALNDNPAPDPNRLRGSILQIAPNGKSYERYATGLRYAYDLAFNNEGDMFFDDNRGNENKYEELNHVVKGGFYGNNPNKYKDQGEAIEPSLRLQYGFAPVGLAFNDTSNDFNGTAGDLFIAFYGPDGQWEDGSISRVRLVKKEDGTYEGKEFPVADKLAKLSDLEFGKTGDLYVSQFGTEGAKHTPYKNSIGAVYRFIYMSSIEPDNPKDNTTSVEGNVHHGKGIFKSSACITCHSVGGAKQLLGPDLAGIGTLLQGEQLLKSIADPNRNIKTGFDQVLIEKKDATIIQGRMVSSSKDYIIIMTIGNKQIKIDRENIKSSNMINSSLMPEGLLDGLTDSDIKDLLGYLRSLKAVD